MVRALRPKKEDIEKYKQEIKAHKAAKVTTPDSIEDYKWAWKIICREHFTKLRLDLKHVADRPIKDSLEADAIEGETLFNTESYFKRYTDWELSHIAWELSEAKHGLTYIENLLKAERDRRKKAGKAEKEVLQFKRAQDATPPT